MTQTQLAVVDRLGWAFREQTPETKRCHWQLVRHDTLTKNATGNWKLLVPEHHLLDETPKPPCGKPPKTARMRCGHN
ncbi:MAG TPA: hypothetical protein VJX10_01395 [Pseudonocardiaceae bacterium]|nr:hypothetical protein [Pseudonocardiaceae bacterium]